MTGATKSHPRRAFAERLERGPLLLDGAMGTLLFSRGVPQRSSLDALVETRPDLIGAIHREYIEAGADGIETNSFGANRFRLAPFGLADRARSLNRGAAQIAREARDVAGRGDVLVFGSIGPLEAPVHGPERTSDAAIRDAFREQVEGLLEGGADVLLFETFSDLHELLLGIAEARALSDLPIVAQMTFGEELTAIDGSSPQTASTALAGAGVDAVGVNCGVGPQICLDALTQMGRPSAGLARSIVPNAGLPQRVAGQFVYAAPPSYFGSEAARFIAAGASIVGGCCGTTPEHIRHMRVALDELAAPQTDAQRRAHSHGHEDRVEGPRTPMTERSSASASEPPPPTRLAALLAAQRFVVSVEIDPPRSVRIERTIEAARLLQEAGVDLVNISDSAMARVRMGALAVAFGIQHDLDLECIVHVTTRDRNLMALESELLGAHALGVRNILALTGDPPRVGDYPTGTGIWDVDSIGLTGILARLNRGEDQAGKPIGAPAGFTIACALDPTADEIDIEIERLAAKIEAGADVVMTQPIYAREQWDRLMDHASARWPGGLPRPVLLGILPLHSQRHAEFLHNEVPGITIPAEVRAAMGGAGDRAAEVGLDIAHTLLTDVARDVQGTYVMPSFGRYELAAELVRRIRRDASVGRSTTPRIQ